MAKKSRMRSGRSMGKSSIVAITVAGGMALGSTSYADEEAESVGEVRSIDGRNNNRANPDFGAAGTHLLREASGTHYADGISKMARPNGPSPRAASSVVFAQTGSI